MIYFFAINYTANVQLDRNLSQALNEAEDYLQSTTQPQQYDLDKDHVIFIKTDQRIFQRRYFDTVYRNFREKRTEAGRAVEDLVTAGDQRYKVIITISRESTRSLVGIISLITPGLIAGLLVVLFITNKYVLNGLWKPFHTTLREIKTFDVAGNTQFSFKSSKVDEFTELNAAIRDMYERVKAEYGNLKLFTENASHELMTPLAVVTTKLDTFIQDETLRPDQLEQVNDIYRSISKLTRLNQALLLLIKLDNELIRDDEPVDLKQMIVEKIQQFQEVARSKDILIHQQLADKEVIASKYLMEILLNNLLSNAIRHNEQHGRIEISLDRDRLVIKNTGQPIKLGSEQIFERFQKSKQSSGMGLGLALVKNICRQNGFDIRHDFAGTGIPLQSLSKIGQNDIDRLQIILRITC
ncbi:sensor histidine kinase [Mucilaginibacter humi]|uniref:sensor histidine kinase n=1 Tax=Mucilaginibacter humi TaxID=2732510 RepID=UPI0015851225|nr:HAMP domain-containing sensor histidine kinase [Mucilaginibacter humi]